jgi:ribonuclease G
LPAYNEEPTAAPAEPTTAPIAIWEEPEHTSVEAEQVIIGVAEETSETGESAEVLPINLPSPEFAAAIETVESDEPDVTSEEAVTESTEEETPEEPLKDSSARVRQRARRGEMATRRGGRGRRRTSPPYRQRTGASDATTDVEDEEGDEEETNGNAPPPLASRPTDRFRRPVISDLLREGQEVLVQIAKEPIGQKGARITSHVALPGRYIVYMPTVEHIGVSRKIGTDEERQRLKRTLHQLRAEAGASGGFIVRTAANGCTLEELREDMQYLIRTWTDIRRRSERAKAPAIVHRDLDLVQRILRDQLSSDFSAIRVDNEFEYERIVDFVNRFAPKLVNRVKLYTKDTPILEHYGVQQEIDKAVKPRVWLKSGGYIVINQTEALVAIDVNTGKFVGKSNRLEDTIVKTNIEAAKEIVRQIRLRDLGGIIVLDLIDMEERRNRAKVMAVLEQELRNDRSPSKVLQFNDFGLVAVTRKRVKQSLERTLCTPCSYCGGAGMVKSAQTLSYEILAEARRISKEIDHHTEVILRVNPEVAKALRTSERDVLAEIEAYLGGVVTIKSDPTVHQEQFDIALA